MKRRFTWLAPSLRQSRAMVPQTGGSSTVSAETPAATRHCALRNSIDYRRLNLDPGEFAQRVGVGG